MPGAVQFAVNMTACLTKNSLYFLLATLREAVIVTGIGGPAKSITQTVSSHMLIGTNWTRLMGNTGAVSKIKHDALNLGFM